MLRITTQEEDTIWRMKLEGKLAGPLVSEANAAWKSAETGTRRVEVDLTGVTAVDGGGKDLLCNLHRAGATFVAEGVWMKATLSDLTGRKFRCKPLTKFRQLVGGLAVALLAQSAFGQEPAQPLRLTLKDAVNIALRQNPDVVIANLDLAESQQGQNIARSALLPQVGFSASDKVQRGNIQALLGKRIPGFPQHNGPFWVIQAGPGFSTPLFDLTAWRRWQAAKESVNVSAAEQTSAREMNAQLVVSQYLGALRAAADVKAGQSRMDLANALVKLATDLQAGGVGTGIDTLRSRVQYQNERQRLTEARTQYKVALFGLAQLLNINPEQEIELSDETSFFETPTFTADATLADAYAQRPELKALAAQMRSAELEKKAVKAERLPKFTASGGWTLQGVSPTSMIPVYQYGVNMEIPLFTGGRIAGNSCRRHPTEETRARRAESEEPDCAGSEHGVGAARIFPGGSGGGGPRGYALARNGVASTGPVPRGRHQQYRSNFGAG